jgi:sigma-70-like protein
MHLDDVLTELVEQSGDRLLRVAYQLTHDAAAAQDLVQEALLRVYQSVRHRGSNTAKQQAGWAVSGRRSLAGGLASLAGQLTWTPHRPRQPIACTAVGGPQTNYLIGLTYPGGARIWVAATDEPNECVGASNRTRRWFPRGRRP